jgi:hypothetical protein
MCCTTYDAHVFVLLLVLLEKSYTTLARAVCVVLVVLVVKKLLNDVEPDAQHFNQVAKALQSRRNGQRAAEHLLRTYHFANVDLVFQPASRDNQSRQNPH